MRMVDEILRFLVASAPMWLPLVLAGLLLIGASVLFVFRRVRRERARAVLGCLHETVRLNLPLPGTLTAAAESEAGRRRKRLWDLSEGIRSGRSVAYALWKGVPEMSPRQVGMIAAAERTGRLPETLRYLHQRTRRADVPAEQYRNYSETAHALIDLFVMLLAAVLFMLMFAVFILPKYTHIMDDFGAVLPDAVYPDWVLQHVLSEQTVLRFLGGLGLVAVAVPLWWLAIWILRRRSGAQGPGALRRFWGRFTWHLPGFRSVVRPRNLADVCFTVGAALRSGLPLPSALREAAQLQLNPVLHERLLRWAEGIEDGASPVEAGRAAGMPALLCGMLGTEQSAGEPHRAFEFLNVHYGGRFSRSIELLRGAIGPAAVVLMAAFVAWMAMLVFLPIVEILNGTIEASGLS